MLRLWPCVNSSTETTVSPWVSLREVVVQFRPDAEPAAYHGIAQTDYAVIVTMNRAGSLVLVRQFRPMVNTFTWEPPGGLVDPGETAEASAKRELAEETGLHPLDWIHLPAPFADAGRLTNRMHVFFALVDGALEPEPGLEARWFAGEDLRQVMFSDPPMPSHHLCALMMAGLSIEVRRLLRSVGLDAPPWMSAF